MKVLISGYYGFGNAGDELILESIISELRSRRRNDAITVLSRSPRQTMAAHGVSAIDRWNPVEVVRAVSDCDMVISGGGGLFQDDTGSLSLYYYLGVLLVAKLFGKKTFVYGVGVNKLKRINKFLTVQILKWADKITVRESDSFNLLVQWKCPESKIEITADPVLLKEFQVNLLREHTPRITFILRPPRQGQWATETFAKLADSLQQRLNARITYIPFHLENDAPFTDAVVRAMQSPARILLWKGFQELYEGFKDSDLVISQRLHGLILAALHGVPLLGISDDPKIDRFLRELGQKNIVKMNDSNFYAILPIVLDIWEWRDDFRKNAFALLPQFKIRAKKMTGLLFEKMDS